MDPDNLPASLACRFNNGSRIQFATCKVLTSNLNPSLKSVPEENWFGSKSTSALKGLGLHSPQVTGIGAPCAHSCFSGHVPACVDGSCLKAGCSGLGVGFLDGPSTSNASICILRGALNVPFSQFAKPDD